MGVLEAQKMPENDNKKGSKTKRWSLFFFIMSCIALLTVISTFVLPLIIVVFGLLSVIVWFIFLAGGTIFTLGMMWTIDGVKDFNSDWMAFNNQIFEAGNTIADQVLKAIPIVVIVSSVFFSITWLFMILGINKDKDRKKYYKGMIIALSVLTVIFIAFSIVTLIMHSN